MVETKEEKQMFKTIDGLFIGIRFGVLGLAALGIAGSVILFFANISLGLLSALLCVAAFALCAALVLLLMPGQMTKKRAAAAAVGLVLAFAIAGITYYTNGGFPQMNLLFTAIR